MAYDFLKNWEKLDGYSSYDEKQNIQDEINKEPLISLEKKKTGNTLLDNYGIDLSNKIDTSKKTPQFSDSETDSETESEGKSGEGLTANSAMQIGSFGLDVASTLGTTSSSESESWMNTGKSAMKGATTGMTVGGPIGAAIGGTIGLGVGVFDAFSDINKRNKETRNKISKEENSLKTKREQEYLMEKGKSTIAKLDALVKSQKNYI